MVAPGGVPYEIAKKYADPTLADIAYQKIRQMILGGRLPEQAKLSESELAEALKMSRTPVREALIRLEREGFAVAIPRQGFYVNNLTEEDLFEIYMIRERLESFAVGIAVKHMTPSIERRLAALTSEFEDAIQEKDYQRCIDADGLFHHTLITASGLQRLIEIVDKFRLQTVSITLTGSDYENQVIRYLDEHKAILQAVMERDSEKAEQLVALHIKNGYRYVASAYEKMDSYSY